ncbi:unnamed protein product [Symbiodinium microadriaticum]|nr:unnamed protein product [Symbiodinium microadriaticum]
MLVKIVLVTGSLPPRVIRDATTRVTSTVQLTSSEGILLPANLHDLLSAFVIMVHKVCKRCMWDALKFKHRKIRTLEYLGVGKARKGLLRRPTLPREQETGEMLWKAVLTRADWHSGDTESLFEVGCSMSGESNDTAMLTPADEDEAARGVHDVGLGAGGLLSRTPGGQLLAVVQAHAIPEIDSGSSFAGAANTREVEADPPRMSNGLL